MSSAITDSVNDLYEQDFYAWTQAQAAKLRRGALAELDRDHLAEEIESMGRSEWFELVDRLAVLLAHLLKWQRLSRQRARYAHSWRTTIEEQRRRVQRWLKKSPSLKYGIEETLTEAYQDAVLQVVKQGSLTKQQLPATCPFTLEQALDDEFWPEAAG